MDLTHEELGNDINCGVSILPNHELTTFCDALKSGDYALIQVMNMRKSGESSCLISNLVENGIKVFINYDAQASMLNHEVSPFGLDFMPINFTQTRPNRKDFPFPIYNNHIRLLITPYICLFSTMDIGGKHNYIKYREPLYSITDCEIVEQLKALYFQAPLRYSDYGCISFESRLGNRLVLDCGRSRRNAVISAANGFIDENSISGTEIEIVSCWFPDACYLSIINAARNGAKIKITTLKPFTDSGKGGISEIPFSVTKLFSAGLSSFLHPNIEVRYVGSLHGKFITTNGPCGTQSFITTSNLTNWGVLAGFEEMAIMTRSELVHDRLRDFSFNF